MKIIKRKDWETIPQNYTGIVEWESGTKIWFKNGIYHREDGPAYVEPNGYKMWYLDGKIIWDSTETIDLINQIIFSKSQHPDYPTVQIWKILNKDGLYEQIVIPGMEEFIIE